MTEEESQWAEALGGALTSIITEKNKTRKWLATKIDVDASTVSRILNGERPPTVDQLAKAARALGVTRRSILARAGYLDGDDTSTVDLDALPPLARRMILAQIKEALGGDPS